ncbi:MAG: type I 3-dehydroquinate dehydratase, partial [Planctomycetota bacterium]
MSSEVPITGVVGVLGGTAREVAAQIERLSDPLGARPHGVEIRADLFDGAGDALAALAKLPRDIGTIFTVRLRDAGGRYAGSEAERVRIYREALERGARLADAEAGTEAARELARLGAPLVVSHHDCEGTPDDPSLEGLAAKLEALRPRVAKLVPTAIRTEDALRILRWVRARGPGGPARVGFAMGPAGVASRVLALAWGSAWT